MVEKLCTPSDDEHNVHKQLQLRELAALNGTLKDISACYICGDGGHDAEHCPKKVRAGRRASHARRKDLPTPLLAWFAAHLLCRPPPAPPAAVWRRAGAC